MDNVNPYQAPSSNPIPDPTLSDDIMLAGRGMRFAGALIDGLVVGGVNFVLLMGLGLVNLGSTAMPSLGNQAIAGVVGFGVFALIQFYFLLQGQTLGKRMLGLRMVDVATNRPPSVGKLLGLRYLPTQVIVAIPVVGALYALVDALFIFGAEQRCLHDLIAGTKVVLAVDLPQDL